MSYLSFINIVYSGSINNNGVYSGTSVSCASGNCRQRSAVIAGSIVGGGIGIPLLVIGIILCCRRYKGRPSKTNPAFVTATNLESHDVTIFKSGIWLSRHLQFGKWYDSHRTALSFDPQSFKVTGSGSDNIGMFTVDGIYSVKTSRMGLTKTYQLSTGNRLENFGQQIIIQLTWNSDSHQFEGKWHVQTKNYRGVDRFELKFSQQQQQISPYEKV